MRATAVVLKAGQHPAPSAGKVDLDGGIADQTRSVGSDRADVKQSDPGELLVTELIGVAEQLVAAAHAQYQRTTPGGGGQGLALVLEEIVGASSWSRSWPPPM